MNVILIILVIIISLITLFLSSSVICGDKKCNKAIEYEKEGRFQEACEFYAIAILNGSMRSKYCREKIKELWSKYGPFDYNKELEDTKAADKKDGINCGEAGFHATMSIIKDIVANEKT